MSEERPKHKTITVANAGNKGKKNTVIELYKAKWWQRNYRPYKRNTWPRPPMCKNDGYWQSRYRVRIDGKWHRPGSCKYVFLDNVGILCLVSKFLIK